MRFSEAAWATRPYGEIVELARQDGSVLVVEIKRGTLTWLDPDGGVRFTRYLPEMAVAHLSAFEDRVYFYTPAGARLYHEDAEPVACVECHGAEGRGRGHIEQQLEGMPPDFTCTAAWEGVPDGQLYWIIENGSGFVTPASGHGAQDLGRPGRRTRSSAMRAHKYFLEEEAIWQLVLYLRSLAR